MVSLDLLLGGDDVLRENRDHEVCQERILNERLGLGLEVHPDWDGPVKSLPTQEIVIRVARLLKDAGETVDDRNSIEEWRV